MGDARPCYEIISMAAGVAAGFVVAVVVRGKLGAGLDEEEKGAGWLSGQNKQRGETRMKQYIFAAWLMVCVGCGGESLTSGPNPLETFDQDRLYVLINAAVNRGRAADCARYFQEADAAPQQS